MAVVRNVQVFRLEVGSQFQGLTETEKKYAHHMARYSSIPCHFGLFMCLTVLQRGLVRGKNCFGASISRIAGDL